MQRIGIVSEMTKKKMIFKEVFIPFIANVHVADNNCLLTSFLFNRMGI